MWKPDLLLTECLGKILKIPVSTYSCMKNLIINAWFQDNT